MFPLRTDKFGVLQNAASISGLLLTTECLITELPEKKAPAGGGGHDHHGHGGGEF